MTATVFRQSYMTQRPSLFTPISYCAIVFSFALIFANGWFTSCNGFYDASACWLGHMKQQTIRDEHWTGLGLDWIRTMMNFVEFGLDRNCKLLHKFRIRTGFVLNKWKRIATFLLLKSCILLIFWTLSELGFFIFHLF